ncbi:DRAP deaminase [Hypoxylon texense]
MSLSSTSSGPRSTLQSNSNLDMSNMKRTAEASRGGKRKGTRSVSTLTPSQLARKRANDREAQRAIRARTKEHIDNLEREIEELRNQQNRDQTVQSLLRQNKSLEDELRRLRESVGLRAPDATDPYQPMFQPSSPPHQSSFGQPVSIYPLIPNMASYGNVSDGTESWPTSMPRSAPSPTSTAASSEVTDDYNGGNYIPTSAPSTGLRRSSLPPNMHSPPLSCINGEGGFDDMKPGFGCAQINMMPVHSAYQYQPWGMYQTQHYHASVPLEQSHPMPQVGRCTF